MREERREGRSPWPASILAALLLAACGGSPTGPSAVAPPPPPPPPKVVIISIDGLRPDALSQAPAPNILDLAARGAYTWGAQTVFPPITLPAHASMLSGYGPATHGMTWGDWRPERGTISVPTVFSVARAAGRRTVMVVGKQKLAHLNAPGSVDSYVLARHGDEQVANEAVAQARAGFDLMFVHLPDTDLAGHANGWMSPLYLQQLGETDAAVGRLLAALPRNVTVILSADHGGHLKDHGVNRPSDMTIPWIIAGPSVSMGPLARGIKTTDTAATAAYVLGLSLGTGAAGEPVLEAFGRALPFRAPELFEPPGLGTPGPLSPARPAPRSLRRPEA